MSDDYAFRFQYADGSAFQIYADGRAYIMAKDGSIRDEPKGVVTNRIPILIGMVAKPRHDEIDRLRTALAQCARCDELTRGIEQAQSACSAWRDAFLSIEAHLKDRIEMNDPAKPLTYLAIIQAEVADVDRRSKSIVNARWADSSRYQQHIARLEAELATALPSTDNCGDSK